MIQKTCVRKINLLCAYFQQERLEVISMLKRLDSKMCKLKCVDEIDETATKKFNQIL